MTAPKKPSAPSAASRLEARLKAIEAKVDAIYELVKPPDPDVVESDRAIDDLIDSIGRSE